MLNPESEWFGEKKVTPQEKTKAVINVFDNVAQQYDIMNDFMSGGIHRIWKNELIHMIRPKASIGDRPMHYLDVAGGTGDIAFRIKEKAGNGAKITLCDLNENMLSVGRDRAINRGWINDFNWVTGNAENLPIESDSVDVYTIAFGLRNVTHIDNALTEAFRVLKSGGRFFCLEFSHVKPKPFAKVYDLYSYSIIPFLGELVAKDRKSYEYLVESIRKFPKQKELTRRMSNAGFQCVKFRNMSLGIVSIHSGFKP